MKEKEETRLLQLKEKENELREKGFKFICGIDEAGRGPLAGPVVVASVIMPADSMIEGVNDSKKISEKKREELYEKIIKEAISYGVAIIGQDEIDEVNILNATKKGLTISLQELTQKLNLQDVHFHHARAEEFGGKRSVHRERYDLVTARAVARISV